MNSSIFYCIVFIFCCYTFYNAEAAAGQPGKCVLNEKTVLSPGQTAKAPNHPCASVLCVAESQIKITPCPAKAPPKGCKLRDFKNTNLDYPACCERNYDCQRHV